MKSKRAYLPGQLRLILAIALVHIIAWLTYYGQIPAGQYPGEEARTTLDSALNLAKGIPTNASGHSLYTYTLSFLARFFATSESLTSAARALNALAFIVAAGFCASAAGHYWRRNRAIWIAGLLVALNPVLVFWAGEVSPSLLATAWMSIALWRLLTWLNRPKSRHSLWVAICLSIAAAFETSLLPLALLWPVLAYFYPQSERTRHLISALIPTALVGGLILVSSLQLQNPFGWHFGSFGSGLYQALSSQETFDDKSFSLYRQLHLILFLNPIHWGLLFILAGAGCYVRLKDGYSRHSILLAVGSLGIFAISLTLNGSGSQARASLIPLLAVFASGVVLLPKIWHRASRSTRRKIQLGGACLGLFAYAGYFGQNQSNTWERDYVYLAKANLLWGNNEQAATWAEKALELNPNQSDTQKVLVLAEFNDWAMSSQPRALPSETAEIYLKAVQQIESTPTTQTIRAIYQYKLREIEAAQATWHAQRDKSALAQLCLYWTGQITEISPQAINTYPDDPYSELLQKAVALDRNALDYGSIEKLLDNMLAFTY